MTGAWVRVRSAAGSLLFPTANRRDAAFGAKLRLFTHAKARIFLERCNAVPGLIHRPAPASVMSAPPTHPTERPPSDDFAA